MARWCRWGAGQLTRTPNRVVPTPLVCPPSGRAPAIRLGRAAQCGNRRARAAQPRGEGAVGQRRVERRGRPGCCLQSPLLVEPVLAGRRQRGVVARGQGRHEEGDPADVVDGVVEPNRGREAPPGGIGGGLARRNPQHDGQIGWGEAQDPARRSHRHPSVQRGGDIVGVSLELGGGGEHR